jgi:hypothetical protein
MFIGASQRPAPPDTEDDGDAMQQHFDFAGRSMTVRIAFGRFG